jgi:hypothetical protein
MENDKIIDTNDRKEVENLWLKKILNIFAIRSTGGVYNGERWEPRADDTNPRPLLIHTGTLTHALRNADVTWNGNDDFAITVEQRQYPGKDVTARDVFLFHQLGTNKMPARPIITDLEKNDIEDIRRLIDQKTQRREERFYKRWYDAFMQQVRFFWR